MGCYPTRLEGAGLHLVVPPQSGEPIRRPLAWHSAQASRPNAALDRAIADGQMVGDRR
jgi:hypothetical protein